MNDKSLTTLADAMLAWTGWKSEISPCRDDKAFICCYGVEAAEKWLPMLHALEDDFYASNACTSAENLQEMADVASAQFRMKHPEVDDSVVQSLAWCYTFDYK